MLLRGSSVVVVVLGTFCVNFSSELSISLLYVSLQAEEKHKVAFFARLCMPLIGAFTSHFVDVFLKYVFTSVLSVLNIVENLCYYRFYLKHIFYAKFNEDSH